MVQCKERLKVQSLLNKSRD